MVYTLTLEGQEEEFDKSKWNGEIGKINKDMILKYLNDDDVVNAVLLNDKSIISSLIEAQRKLYLNC